MLQRDPAAAIAAAGKPGRSEVPLLGLTASSQGAHTRQLGV